MRKIIRVDKPECDGRLCGLGKHVGGGKYVCPHNNLAVKFPELKKEWDYDKNQEGPEEFFPRSNRKIWWRCKKKANVGVIIGWL